MFVIEVNLMLWTVTGCRVCALSHMFCNCTQTIRIGDRVVLRQDVELNGQDNLLQPNVVYWCQTCICNFRFRGSV